MPKRTLIVVFIGFALTGCLESEDSCIDEIVSDIERTESVIPKLIRSSEAEKAELRMSLLSVTAAVSAMRYDEHRNACDYYWQNGSRLARK